MTILESMTLADALRRYEPWRCGCAIPGGIRVGIMQPYYFPYIGYFSLIAACDVFIFHNDVKYTKKGWINRNYLDRFGNPFTFTLPLSRSSDSAMITEKKISDTYDPDKQFRIIKAAYQKAPFWEELEPLLAPLLHADSASLSRYLQYTLTSICGFLDIKVNLRSSASLRVPRDLRGAERVLEICRRCNATQYLNPVGGIDLYDAEEFAREGVALHFLDYHDERIASPLTDSAPTRLGPRERKRFSIIHSLAHLGVEATKAELRSNSVIECRA